MSRLAFLLITLVACLPLTLGCTADVETTEDSTRLEIEGPKLEVGDEETDLNPETDDDIDIDTPLEGDR